MAANTAALRGITKQYKDFTLGPVDMTVPAGSIAGLDRRERRRQDDTFENPLRRQPGG